MYITILRHFKVNYQWKKTYNSHSFQQAQTDYDNADIITQKLDLPLQYDLVILSSLKRTKQTYDCLQISVPFIKNELLDEIPLAPYKISSKEISVLKWLIMGRIHWFLNIHSQPEIRRESKRKVQQIIDELCKMKKNCLIISHGVRLGLLAKQLRLKGFNGSAIRDPRNGIPYTYYK